MADRYWVGGSNTWNNSTANWSATNGGASGASVPGAADTAFFTSLSGTVTVTWNNVDSLTVLAIVSTGFTGTHATGGNAKTLAGTGAVWTSPSGCTITGAPTLTVNSTGATAITVTCNHASPSTANAPNFSFTGGTYGLTLGGSGFRTINFTGKTSGSVIGVITIYGDYVPVSGCTYTSAGIVFRTSTTFNSLSKIFFNVDINVSGGTVTLGSTLNIGNTTGSTIIDCTLTAGTLDLNGFAVVCGRFSSSNANTRAISFGSGNITVRGTGVLVSMATATGFTYTGTGGFLRVLSLAGTSEFTFGSTAGGSASNAPNITASPTGNTMTLTSGSHFKNVNFTSSTSTVTGTYNAYGNLTLGSGGTYTAVVPTFRASGTITSAGRTLGATTINGSGITVTLADAFVSNGALTLTEGTFDNPSNFNVTAGSFSSNNSNTRTLNMGSGTWTISGSGATAWNTATTTGLTVVPSTSTITMTNASAKTFAGGGVTYYNLNQGGAGALTISGSNTFNNITNSTQPATVRFTAGTTQTVSAFGLSGTAGNLITINSDTPGSQFTLSDASGTINAQYLSIQDSVATGGATWNALISNGNVNAGNNTGWIFGSAATGNMFLMFS